ncbi:MAG: glycosyltransferase, partial [Oscillospiraceae bacterium]|nr:glycosyltransferase [Oscillospiraceae bacterium]
MGEIIISVIVPVYNAQEHIIRCLDSILSQTVSALEVICVDDGSADNSAALIEEAALRDSRIRLIKQENRHAGEARNNGIGNANGEYIAFLDADDIYYTDRALELLLRKAMETGADMVKGSFRYLDENGRIFS